MSDQKEAPPAAQPFVEVLLSRSSYRVGEAVVGTVRLVAPIGTPPNNNDASNNNNNNDDNTACWPREIFSDAYIYVAGWCRLDPRWHNRDEYARLYQSPGVHHGLHTIKSKNGSVVIDEKSVCFWTTNVVNLMELKERTIGRWEDVKPKSLKFSATTEDGINSNVVQAKLQTPIGGSRGREDASSYENGEVVGDMDMEDDGTADEDSHNNGSSLPLEQRQLAFTFRAELPLELPQSVRLNSCRYFYSVMVGTRARMPHSPRKQWIRHCTPLHVMSPSPIQQPPSSVPADNSSQRQQVSVGLCTAMAHAAGLPCHVTANDLHQPTGQIHVNRQGTASLGNLVNAPHKNSNLLQTMRITDLQGAPCCVLSVMGVSVATPGSRMVLKFDFPTPRQQSQNPWTPCYQVSASLEGEEVAIHSDGTRKRTRAYQFDTANEAIDPECTERVCLSLLLPLDAPTTIKTSVVDLDVHLCIDITVGNTANQSGANKFNNLRLKLPCRVAHSLSEYELIMKGENEEEGKEDEMMKLPLDELILGADYRTGQTDDPDQPPLIETEALRKTNDFSHPNSFRTKDIRQDLKLLSIRMAKECNLVER